MAVSTYPGAPTLTTRGDTSLSLQWSAASTTDGSTITGYVLHVGSYTTSTSGTSGTVSGLTGGTAYNCYVTANFSDSTSADSGTNTATTNPQAPNPPTTSSRTTTSIDLSSTGPGNWGAIYIVDDYGITNMSPASFSGYSAGTTHSFHSYATIQTSSGATLTSTNSSTNNASTLPNPPPGASIDTVTSTSIIVNTGSAPSGGATNCEVTVGSSVKTGSWNSLVSFTVSANTTYSVSVRTAFSPSGGTLYSSSVSLGSVKSGPAAPSGISARSNTSTTTTSLSATLSFTRNSDYTDWDWSWTSTSWDVTGVSGTSVTTSSDLSYSTTYSYVGRGTTGSMVSGTVSGSFTTPAPPLPGTPSAAPSLDTAKGDAGRLQGGLYLKWGSATNVQRYVITATRVWDSHSTTYEFTTNSGTITGLDDGTAYDLYVFAYNAHGQSATTAANRATTKPSIPTISADPSSSAVSITINVSMPSANNYTDVTVRRLNSSGTLIDSKVVTNTQTQAIWDTGVAQNTTYQFDARSRFNVSAVDLFSDYCAKITFKTDRPTNWKWTTAIDANGHKTSGTNFSMLATEWKAFQDKVDSFRTAKGIAVYSWTRAAAGGTFSASFFNEAITAINAITTKTVATPSTKASGDACNAADFNTLMDSLNSTP